MKWLIKLCLCLPLLAQAQILTIKIPGRPIQALESSLIPASADLANRTTLSPPELDMTPCS